MANFTIYAAKSLELLAWK